MVLEQILPWVLLASLVGFTAWWVFRPSARSRKTDFRVITASAVLVLMTGGFMFWQSGFRPPRPGYANPGPEVNLQACPDYENFNRCSPSLPDGIDACSWSNSDWARFCGSWVSMEINWQKQFCTDQCPRLGAVSEACFLCCDEKYKGKHREDLRNECRDFVCEKRQDCGGDVDCSKLESDTEIIQHNEL